VKTRDVDLRRPLVTDMSGEMINVSFQAIDDATRSVRFYAPVLAGAEYRQRRRSTTIEARCWRMWRPIQ